MRAAPRTDPSARPRFWQRYSVEKFVRDLMAVFDAAAVKRAVLIGHSRGGITAMKFYELFPDMVEALVLVDTTYTNPVETSHLPSVLAPGLRILSGVASFPLGMLEPAGSMFRVLSARLPGHVRIASQEDVELVVRNLLGTSYHVSALAFHAMMNHDAGDLLPGIKVPVMVFVADNDWMVSTRSSKKMKNLIGDCELVVFRGEGGHMAYMTAHEFFNRRIQQFLDRIGYHEKGSICSGR